MNTATIQNKTIAGAHVAVVSEPFLSEHFDDDDDGKPEAGAVEFCVIFSDGHTERFIYGFGDELNPWRLDIEMYPSMELAMFEAMVDKGKIVSAMEQSA